MHAIANPRIVVFKTGLNMAPSYPSSCSIGATKPLEYDGFLMRGTDRVARRFRRMPPFYRDPAVLLLAVTAAATAFFAVYVTM